MAFTDNGRLFGESAHKEQTKKPELTISFSNRLLGVPYSDQQARDNFMSTYQPIELIEDSNRTSITYRIKGLDVTNEEVIVMILEHAKKMSERFGDGQIKDCSITVPSFWNRAQRFALIYSAYAAGLNVLSLINENTAAAFYYAIDRLDNSTTHHALFYNLGASYLQVSVAKYNTEEKLLGSTVKQIESVTILAHTSDRFIGGSLFDRLITEHLAKEFQSLTGLDVKESPRSMVRLYQQAQRVKKTLSASKSTPVTVNNLYKDKDLKTIITRETFEELLAPYIERLIEPVYKALEMANLKVEEIDSFELIGGVSRIPKIQETLKEKLKIELGTHLNGDEAMAHGAAIFAANYSSIVHVKPMYLTDIVLYNVSAKLYNQGETEAFKDFKLFSVGNALRTLHNEIIQHSENIDIVVQIDYGSGPVDVASFKVEGVKDLSEKSGKAVDLMLIFALDGNGIPFLYQVLNKYEVDAVRKVPKLKKVEETDENSAEEPSEAPVMTEPEFEEQTYKEVKEGKLNFTQTDLETPRLLSIEEAQELIARVASYKAKEEDAKRLAEVKNDLESYVYYVKEKLEESSFLAVTKEDERERFDEQIAEVKDYMQSEDYNQQTLEEIKAKKNNLEKVFSDALEREKESEVRDQIVADSLAQITKLEEKLININATKPWIPAEDMNLGWTKINETKIWIDDKVKEQSVLKPWEPLAYKTSDVLRKLESCAKQVEKLQRMTKPKPKIPDFVNFGKDFDWSKFKMENVTVDGEEVNSENTETKENSEEDTQDTQDVEDLQDSKEDKTEEESGHKADL